MKTILTIAALAVSTTTATAASDARIAEYVNKRMAISILCEPAIGSAWAMSAKTIGQILLVKAGYPQSEVIAELNKIEKKFREDKRTKEFRRKAEMTSCLMSLQDINNEYADVLQ